MSDICMPDGQTEAADEIARLMAELSEARRIVHNLADHNYAFSALKAQARDFLAKHPEADPPS